MIYVLRVRELGATGCSALIIGGVGDKASIKKALDNGPIIPLFFSEEAMDHYKQSGQALPTSAGYVTRIAGPDAQAAFEALRDHVGGLDVNGDYLSLHTGDDLMSMSVEFEGEEVLSMNVTPPRDPLAQLFNGDPTTPTLILRRADTGELRGALYFVQNSIWALMGSEYGDGALSVFEIVKDTDVIADAINDSVVYADVLPGVVYHFGRGGYQPLGISCYCAEQTAEEAGLTADDIEMPDGIADIGKYDLVHVTPPVEKAKEVASVKEVSPAVVEFIRSRSFGGAVITYEKGVFIGQDTEVYLTPLPSLVAQDARDLLSTTARMPEVANAKAAPPTNVGEYAGKSFYLALPDPIEWEAASKKVTKLGGYVVPSDQADVLVIPAGISKNPLVAATAAGRMKNHASIISIDKFV